MNAVQPDTKFFYMTLKKNVSKGGRVYYTGKYAYAIEILGFEKADGSGDITLHLKPKDMDLMKQESQAQRGQHPYAPKNQAPQPAKKPYTEWKEKQASIQRAPPPLPSAPQKQNLKDFTQGQEPPENWNDPEDPGFGEPPF